MQPKARYKQKIKSFKNIYGDDFQLTTNFKIKWKKNNINFFHGSLKEMNEKKSANIPCINKKKVKTHRMECFVKKMKQKEIFEIIAEK